MDEPRCRGRGRRCGASSMQLRREAWPGAGGARRNPPLPGLCWGGWALLSAGAVRGRSGTASPGPGPEGQHTHQLDALRKGVVLPVLLGEALQNLSLSIPAACRKERRIRGQAASRGRRAELQQCDTPTNTAATPAPPCALAQGWAPPSQEQTARSSSGDAQPGTAEVRQISGQVYPWFPSSLPLLVISNLALDVFPEQWNRAAPFHFQVPLGPAALHHLKPTPLLKATHTFPWLNPAKRASPARPLPELAR